MTTFQEIPLSKVKISEQNVRTDVGDVSELAQSIAEKGMLEPIVVRPENGKYGVVIGSRRFTAAKEAKEHVVPAIIREMSDGEALLISLLENIQRNDLEPKDETVAVVKCCETFSKRGLAKKIGKSDMWVRNMVDTANLVRTLEKHNIAVQKMPKDPDRKAGKAIPFNHAIHLGNALEYSNVKEHFKDKPQEAENKTVELAKAITPITQTDAQKVLEVFKHDPWHPVKDIVEQALEPYLIDMSAGGGGGGSLTETTSDWHLQHEKNVYNLKRTDLSKYAFFTVGYSHVTVEQFIEKLKIAGVKTLIDVRKNPQSMYRYEFNKEPLESTLKRKGIRYLHAPELGVPSDLREDLSSDKEYEKLWKWYDKNVAVPHFDDDGAGLGVLEDIMNESSSKSDKAAFMCMELDPTKCHRHRIALYLETRELTSLDL